MYEGTDGEDPCGEYKKKNMIMMMMRMMRMINDRWGAGKECMR